MNTNQTPTAIARDLIIQLLTDNPNGLTRAQLNSLICAGTDITPGHIRNALAYMCKGRQTKRVYQLVCMNKSPINPDDMPEPDNVQQSVVNAVHTDLPVQIRLSATPYHGGVAASVFQLMAGAV